MIQLDVDRDLLDLVERFFHDRCPPEVVTAADGSAAMPADLWAGLSELGLTLVGIDESGGGSGGTLLDAVAVVAGAARYAAPLPLVETWLASWLAASSGVPVSPVATAVAAAAGPTSPLTAVPWLGAVPRLHLLVGDQGAERFAALDVTTLTVRAGLDLAGQPHGTASLDGVALESADTPVTTRDLALRRGLLRTAQLAGAMTAVQELTWRYTQERHQFGKPLASFQAVQQHLVIIAQCASSSLLAVQRAARAVDGGDGHLEVAAARIVVAQNAVACSRAAHQAHGAIGMTREYPLQQLTRRLALWREDVGALRPLARALGEAAAAAPSFHRLVADMDRELVPTW